MRIAATRACLLLPKCLEMGIERFGDTPAFTLALAYCYAGAGDVQRNRQIFERTVEIWGDRKDLEKMRREWKKKGITPAGG